MTNTTNNANATATDEKAVESALVEMLKSQPAVAVELMRDAIDRASRELKQKADAMLEDEDSLRRDCSDLDEDSDEYEELEDEADELSDRADAMNSQSDQLRTLLDGVTLDDWIEAYPND